MSPSDQRIRDQGTRQKLVLWPIVSCKDWTRERRSRSRSALDTTWQIPLVYQVQVAVKHSIEGSGNIATLGQDPNKDINSHLSLISVAPIWVTLNARGPGNR